jgi:hypothetical protein
MKQLRSCLRLWPIALLLCTALWVDRSAVGQETASERQSDPKRIEFFDARIAPLLASRCLECHGPETKKGGLDLSQREAALAGGKNGEAVVPGKLGDSLAWKMVDSDKMPKDGPPLSAEEKERFKQWIEAGAVWSDAVVTATPRMREAFIVRRLTVPEYIDTVRTALEVDIADDARRLLPRDVRADGFSNTAYNLSIDLAHVEAYARLAELIAARADLKKLVAEHAGGKELNAANQRDIIASLGKWVLRGPLEDREIDSYASLAQAVTQDGGNAEEAMRYVLEAMVQSPRFLYRMERQRGNADEPLSGVELASRLSYTLWGAPPDKELYRAAEAGELADRRNVETQVDRMLGDPRAVERSAQFIAEWMHLDRLANLRPSEKHYPHWDARLAADMRSETVAFFKHVAWEEKRPLEELLNAPVTFATPRLARHYGLDRTAGDATEPSAPPTPDRVAAGLQLLYRFEEGKGDSVRDSAEREAAGLLKIADAAAVQWNERGMFVNRSTLIASEQPPKELVDALKKSNAITIEAWLTPANASQTGPARIVTLSSGIGDRNFTLGQFGDRFALRLRTTKTNANGEPALLSSPNTASNDLVHVLYTRDAKGKAVFYINGQEQGTLDVGGDFSNWKGDLRLALANETSRDRPWSGALHLVAIYDRALSAGEARQNHAAGVRRKQIHLTSSTPAPTTRSTDALEVLYRFNEREGNVVRDHAGRDEPLPLSISSPDRVERTSAGLLVKGPVLLTTEKPPQRLLDAVKKSREISLEAWFTPADNAQQGPARILTLSSGSSERNFTLGQEGDAFELRFRAAGTDNNGMPGLRSPAGSAAARRTHVAFTRDAAGKGRLYVDGSEVASRDFGGDLGNWNGRYLLGLANETTNDRPWRGTLHQVAIYSRALSAEEIRSGASIEPESEELARYDLSKVPARGGLLTQGSTLTIGGDEGSMVTRGLFILREFLYSGVEDPPPCVDTTPVPTKPGQSQRVVAMQRLTNEACASCHSRFEPFAFGLEKFDGLGALHEKDEHGNTLRDDGEVIFPDREEPVAFASSAELMNLLARSERVQRGITRKATQYAIGRPLSEADEPRVEQIHQATRQNGATYAALIRAIVLSDLVQKPQRETNP